MGKLEQRRCHPPCCGGAGSRLLELLLLRDRSGVVRENRYNAHMTPSDSAAIVAVCGMLVAAIHLVDHLISKRAAAAASPTYCPETESP